MVILTQAVTEGRERKWENGLYDRVEMPLNFISDSSLQPVPLTLYSLEHLESREPCPSGV